MLLSLNNRLIATLKIAIVIVEICFCFQSALVEVAVS